jgi:hypothetical protein
MEFFLALKKALPILSVIFIAVFVLILLARLVFATLLHFAKENYKSQAKAYKTKHKKKFVKKDDELSRKKDDFKSQVPIAHSLARRTRSKKKSQNYEIISSQEQEEEKRRMSESQIVDFVKPIGFWTAMIFGQKMTYLIQSAKIMNKNANKGFWRSMIEAQERAAGRQRGRTM